MALPFLMAKTEPFHYGGQAGIEGVMMRGRPAMAVAVRHPSGEVVVHTEPLQARVYRSAWGKRPFIRGVLLLWDTLALGMRALVYSASVAAQEEAESAAQTAFGGRVMWGTMAVALTFGIGIFFVSPLLVTRAIDRHLPSA